MDNAGLTKILRQQANKISARDISRAEMDAILTDIGVAVKAFRKARRQEFWKIFWQDFNDPKRPRLFF